jgi:hypothetical protein
MAKLKLNAAPTFKAPVSIPVAGDEPAVVELTFKHRTKSALDEFIDSFDAKPHVETFMDMVVGWDLEDDFNKESVATLLENYIGTPQVTFRAYLEQLLAYKVKN